MYSPYYTREREDCSSGIRISRLRVGRHDENLIFYKEGESLYGHDLFYPSSNRINVIAYSFKHE